MVIELKCPIEVSKSCFTTVISLLMLTRFILIIQLADQTKLCEKIIKNRSF